jgi:hypothetical protein
VAGYVFRSRLGLEALFTQWHNEVSTELLFASYTEFAERHHERHPMSRETMGRFLRRMGAKPKRLNRSPIGEHLTDEVDPFGRTHRVAKPFENPRPMGYSLGTLELARQGFTEATGLHIEWLTSQEP